MASSDAPPTEPYKYLNYYGLADGGIFCGREREIRTLVSDIVVGRLVVLFAETGTGKTSLINAGVRPRLEGWTNGARPPMNVREYATYHVRVKEDAARSIRAELSDIDVVSGSADGDPLAPALKEAVRSLSRPIVLFLDQFEEFFVYRDAATAARRRQFIEDVGSLYRDEESGVHLVFSMREEFLGKMDAFRDQIPTIFHKDSQLRLAWFEPEQAHDAIKLPARAFGVEITEDAVRAILVDLTTADGVEPAQLQIVCDTLWHAPRGRAETITVDDYRRLATGPAAVRFARMDALENSVAKRVLGRRFETDLKDLVRKPALDGVAAILPELSTPADTKRIRDLSGLMSATRIDSTTMNEIVDYLTKSRLVQKVTHDGIVYIELAHDYLVTQMPALEARVRTLLARRILTAALQARRESGTLMAPESLEEVRLHGLELEFDRELAELLFLSALEWGHDLPFWFGLAEAQGVKVWPMLETIVESRDVSRAHVAQSVVYLLSGIRSDRSLALLERALAHDDLAPSAIDALANVKTRRSVELLAAVLAHGRFVAEVQTALKILARAREADVAAAAEEVLNAPSGQPPAPAPTLDQTKERAAASAELRDQGRLPPIGIIRQLLDDGLIVPFLGAGVNVGARPQGAQWTLGAPFLPLGMELAQQLAADVDYPRSEQLDPLRVATYFELKAGRSSLRHRLRQVFSVYSQPTRVLRYLARLPKPLLILTRNFDVLLEHAFREIGRAFDVVTYPVDQDEFGGAVLWQRHGEPAAVPVEPNQLDIDLHSTPVIFKVAGSFHATDEGQDNYVITEDDYVDLAVRLLGARAIPSIFAEALQTRPMLFLGISLDDWLVRTLIRTFRGKRRRNDRSFAILRNPSELTRTLWTANGVTVADMDMDEFVLYLEKDRR